MLKPPISVTTVGHHSPTYSKLRADIGQQSLDSGDGINGP
jgi:hypothetical protein